jgi:hypothetical protein
VDPAVVILPGRGFLEFAGVASHTEGWLPLQKVTRTSLACLSMQEAIAVQNLARIVA